MSQEQFEVWLLEISDDWTSKFTGKMNKIDKVFFFKVYYFEFFFCDDPNKTASFGYDRVIKMLVLKFKSLAPFFFN